MKTRAKFFLSVTILSILLILGIPIVSAGGVTKVPVCHLDDEGNFILISIADPALDSHLAHGDGEVGVDVDESCLPLNDRDGDDVLNADDNCIDVYNPDQSDRYGSSKGDACEDDSNGDGILDVNEPQICVSINGILVIKRGLNALCQSTAAGSGYPPNIAVANGNNTAASAGMYNDPTAVNNTAVADGNSFTSAYANGSNNIAKATGVNVLASAQMGDNNTAIATGDGAQAIASVGNYNTAIATGIDAFAGAYIGSYNTAVATGDGAWAEAKAAEGCTAQALGVNVSASCP